LNIKVKFIIFNTVLIILITCGLGFLSILSVRKLLNNEAEKRGADLAESLARASISGNILKDESSILATIQELMKGDHILSANVSDADGKIVAHNDIRDVGKTMSVKRNRQVQYDQTKDFIPYIEISVPIHSTEAKEEDLLLTKMEMEMEKSLEGEKFLGSAQIQLSLENVAKIIKKMALLIGLIVASSILIAMGLVYFSLNVLLSPLQILKRGVDLFGSGNLTERIKVSSKDEIADLSESFNQMAEKLQNTLSDLKTAKEMTEELNKNLEVKVKERTQELENAQTKLVLSEKMSAVGQLAAGIAHEINNPLGIIMGFSQGISQRVKPGDPLEMPVKSIERESVRCKNLVQDLLTFSRTDANKSDRIPIDLNKAVEGSIRLVEAGAKMNSAVIKMELSPNIPHVLGNQNQIQQVVINLANNAIDAMPKGGTLRITTEILQDQHLSWACLKVSDTGDGIPKEVQPKIFEPFFTTKPVGKGTGLGLSLLFEIIKKHSGTIEVQSQPGLTEFCVKFPIRTA